MWLAELEVDRLRNLRAVRLTLAPGLTLVAGKNGQGKTSLLEAVYLLATGRSFRTRRLDDLVAWEGGPLRVAGRVEERVGRSELVVIVDGAERRLLAGGREERLLGWLGRLDVVDLTAERMLVMRGAPGERRRFLDRGVVGLDGSFLHVLGEYRRVLAQRNALLRGGRRPAAARRTELDAWDERLAGAGAGLHRGRRAYAVRLAAALPEPTRRLFPEGRELTLRYRPSPASAGEADPSAAETILGAAIARGRDRDLAVGHTCTGPHRDDLAIELDGVDLRRFGSAGQVRSALVALKFGKLFLLNEERGTSPVFLMDDFDSDLDEARAGALATFLHEGRFQALVATSKEALADRLGVELVRIRMDGGSARTV